MSISKKIWMLLSTGEQVSVALLSMALHALGEQAVSLTGWQAGIRTEANHGKARIIDIQADRIMNALNQGRIVIISPHTENRAIQDPAVDPLLARVTCLPLSLNVFLGTTKSPKSRETKLSGSLLSVHQTNAARIRFSLNALTRLAVGLGLESTLSKCQADKEFTP